jgi:hypothetical protein
VCLDVFKIYLEYVCIYIYLMCTAALLYREVHIMCTCICIIWDAVLRWYSCRTPGVITARVYSFPTCFSYYYYHYNIIHHPGEIVPTSPLVVVVIVVIAARPISLDISHTHTHTKNALARRTLQFTVSYCLYIIIIILSNRLC